jgi:N-acetylmuramoyl-L-alanine amidase
VYAAGSLKSLLLLMLLNLALSTDALALRSGPRRQHPPDMVVIHSTGGPTCDTNGNPIWVPAGELRENLRTIEAHPRLGVHYMIDRDGTLVASVPERQIAYHVFVYSPRSIGIELVNDGDGADPFPEPQLAALVGLLRQIARRHSIGAVGIRRHSDLDRGRMPCAPDRPRKVDPGPAFPYEDIIRRTFAAP